MFGVCERGGVVGVCIQVMGWGAGVRTRGNAGMLVAVGVTLLLLVFLVFCLGLACCPLVCGLGGQTDCASRLFFIPWTPLSFFPVSGLMKTYLRKGIWLIFQNRVWAERWRHRGGQETAGGDPGRVLLLFFLIGGATAELPCAAKLWPGENKRAPRACSWCSPQVP